jgi:hypothetical protein
MHWLRSGLLLVAASIVAIGTIDVAKGAKPGGGTTPPPPGTIYFRHAGAMWKMDGAGTPSSRVPLPAAPTYGVPSYARHGNQRWFVYDDEAGLPGEFPKFPNDRDVRDIWAGSEGGADILLLSESDIEVISEPIWAADDGSITFIGERWELDADGEPFALDAGLYELSVDFIGGVPIAGSLEFIADLSDQIRAGADGFPGYQDAEPTGHSWNSGRTAFAFGIRFSHVGGSEQEIWIVDLANVTDPSDVPPGALSLFASGNGVGWPECFSA